MKQKIHPKYFNKAKVNCACGNSWTTGSTKAEINVEICAECHPFFTGKAKLVDTAGRVDRFRARLEQSKKMTSAAKERKEAKQKKATAETAKPKTDKTEKASPKKPTPSH